MLIYDKEDAVDENDRRRLFVCFGAAVLHHYRNNIVAVRGQETVGGFRLRNPALVRKMCDEALRVFNFQLDWMDVDSAIELYIRPGQMLEGDAKPFSIP